MKEEYQTIVNEEKKFKTNKHLNAVQKPKPEKENQQHQQHGITEQFAQKQRIEN